MALQCSSPTSFETVTAWEPGICVTSIIEVIRAAATVNREVECRGAKPGEKRTLKPLQDGAILHVDAKSWVDEVRAKRRHTL